MNLIVKPVGEGQIGADFPGILSVEFELIVLEVSFLSATVWKHAGGFVVVKIRDDSRIAPEKERKEVIPIRNGGIIPVDVRGTKGRIERTEIAAQANTNEDRKSTRLNSSHLGISYAVFCLK